MMNRTEENFQKAAALYWALGGNIPHQAEREKEALETVRQAPDREKVLLRAAALCGSGDDPARRYLLAKIYSWLGAPYARETIRWASAYLSGEPWKLLPRQTVRLEGILVSQESAVRASLFADMAQAQTLLGESGPALSNYSEAFRLEPYNAMYPVKIADVLAATRGLDEALNYLKNQKASAYYKPVSYMDVRGGRKSNDTFRQLLDSHIRKLTAQKENLL